MRKDVERVLKKLHTEAMKNPEDKLQYNLMEIEPATLTELARKIKKSREETLKVVRKLVKANVLSVSCTKADKLMAKHRKKMFNSN